MVTSFSPSLDDLKLAEFVPMYKKNNPMDKENYRPVTLSCSKIFENKKIHSRYNSCNLSFDLHHGYYFSVTFLFLLVWSKQKSDKKVKTFILFLICMTVLLLKYKNYSDFCNDLRTRTKSEFLASEFMNICDDIQVLLTRMSSIFNSVSKLKYRNLNSFFHLLILLKVTYNSKHWTYSSA